MGKHHRHDPEFDAKQIADALAAPLADTFPGLGRWDERVIWRRLRQRRRVARQLPTPRRRRDDGPRIHPTTTRPDPVGRLR